jgi:hypothetical protein
MAGLHAEQPAAREKELKGTDEIPAYEGKTVDDFDRNYSQKIDMIEKNLLEKEMALQWLPEELKKDTEILKEEGSEPEAEREKRKE